MKKHILYIILIGVLFSCGSNSNGKNSSSESNKMNIEELEKVAFDTYQKTPQDAIPKFKEIALEYKRLKNFKKAGFTNLNISNIYDEHLNQIDSALAYSSKSLGIWKTENDSMQMANLYKYIGLLQSKQGRFQEAKSSIQQAITIYTNQGFEQGVAVSEINLADSYFREKNFEKSISYFNKSKNFWLRKNEKGRIYTDNILGIKIFSVLKRNEKVEKLIRENKEIEKEVEINSFVKTKFEELVNEIKKEVKY